MFNRIIEKIKSKLHFGLNAIVWDWVQFHVKESGVSFIEYMFKKTHNHFVIVDSDNKSMVYECGFASYTIFDCRAAAEYYARENELKYAKIIYELDFLKTLGLDTNRIFTINKFKKIWK